MQSVLLKQEPLWLENRIGTRSQLPDAVQSWVYEVGSLTQRLRAVYGRSVTVKLLFQEWRKPLLSERRLLGLHERQWCLSREVLLHASGVPLILARTIIPISTIKIANRSLSHLGTRPLGEVIFSYPKLERIAMDVAQIQATTWTDFAHDTAGLRKTIWARRTVYAIKQRQMLVSEFFLPEIL